MLLHKSEMIFTKINSLSYCYTVNYKFLCVSDYFNTDHPEIENDPFKTTQMENLFYLSLNINIK